MDREESVPLDGAWNTHVESPWLSGGARRVCAAPRTRGLQSRDCRRAWLLAAFPEPPPRRRLAVALDVAPAARLRAEVVLDEVAVAGADGEHLRAARGGGEAEPLHLGGEDLHGRVGALGRLLVEPVAGRLLRAGRRGAVVVSVAANLAARVRLGGLLLSVGGRLTVE